MYGVQGAGALARGKMGTDMLALSLKLLDPMLCTAMFNLALSLAKGKSFSF